MSWANKEHNRGRGRGRGRGASLPATARLQQTREKHNKATTNALKTLYKSSDVYESSSEEEDLDDKVILNAVLKTYKGGNEASDSISELNNAVQHVYESCQSGAVTCLVCISSVKRSEAIWSCHCCYATFHLMCIQRWIREGIAKASVLSDDLFPLKDLPWYCPKCRNEFSRNEQPSKYMCYCEKIEDPPFDPWIVPHSCGETCDKPLKPNCGHRCLLLCHPGACPPCPQTVRVGCHCGKEAPTNRRCGASTWSCGQKCLKTLNCNRHPCKNTCHKGKCGDCTHQRLVSCTCGKAKAEVACGTETWNCEQICGKKYSCGAHICEKVCHRSGECGKCPREGRRCCPCGKKIIEGLKCTDEVDTCDDTCGKKLGCDAGHKCSRRCHYGPCGQCPLMVEKECRCGKRMKETPCFKEFLCDIKCQRKRNCGNHQCRRKCCDGNCPSCEIICGKTLQCKQHKCPSLCHQGMCYPCILSTKVTCKCGSSSVTVVCGKQKLTKPPRCHKFCKEPSECHHPAQVQHYCHIGECPPCKQMCDLPLDCGHNCPVPCHDAVLVKHEVKAAGPWDLTRQTTSIEKLPCPECKVPIQTLCHGKHDYFPLPCFEAKPISCGRICGRLLKCENHNCARECHEVSDAPNDTDAGNNCVQCEKHCDKERPDGCTHECSLPCHPGPCEPCKKRIRKRCHCNMVIKHHVCWEWTKATGAEKIQMESCGGMCPKPLSCGHMCSKECHDGQCSEVKQCLHRVTVRCKCKRLKKSFRCYDVQNGAQLNCDEECKNKQQKLKAEKDELEAQKREDEEKLQRIELEKFERKMKGKKRKKVQEQEEDDQERKVPYSAIIFLLAAIGLAVFIYFNVFVVELQ